MRHFHKNQILSDKQHGFRAKCSCETQLTSTIQNIANNLTWKSQTDIILIDFAKSFNKVPHHRLLHKLNYYGVRESTLCWMESFLSQRKQSVLFDSTQSTEADYCLGCSKPQSSGPYFSRPLLMNCQSPQNTQMPDYLLTTAFSIDMSRQVKTKSSSRKN